MFEITKNRMLLAGGLLALAGLFAWGMRPPPIPVDLAEVVRGPLEVTVNEEGVTRIKEIYTVSAPVAGRLLRLTRDVGDIVEKDKTIVATIQPVAPSFLDIRARRVAEADVQAAQAAARSAEARMEQAQTQLNYAIKDLQRTKKLADRRRISPQALDHAELEVSTKEAALRTSQAEFEMRQKEQYRRRAQLIEPGNGTLKLRENCCVHVKAPVTGRVLEIMQKSAQVVPAGTQLLKVGNPASLEIVVDLLSSDAVSIKTGAAAVIENWGGGRTLKARVRRIEPAGFKKISALGIEEQRVRTILDFEADQKEWQRLGHDFRIYARINAWQGENVLSVPLAALFRKGADWAVFVADGGAAKLRRIKLGHRNQQKAEVLDGLSERDQVILHPSDRIEDDARIVSRRELSGN